MINYNVKKRGHKQTDIFICEGSHIIRIIISGVEVKRIRTGVEWTPVSEIGNCNLAQYLSKSSFQEGNMKSYL